MWAMAMSTVAERIKRLLKLLSDDKVRSIVLFGESGVGKTWTARKISSIARKKGSIDIALCVFLNREYGGDTLCESIAYQLSLHSTNGESEFEDDNEENEDRGGLQLQMSMILPGKKLLRVLDDEGTKMDEQQIMTELKTLLNLENQDYKVLITKRNSSGSISSEYSERQEIEVKPLLEEESLSSLQERAGTGVCKVPGSNKAFVAKTKRLPAAIVFMAKALNHSAQQVSGVEILKCSLEEESGIEIYNLIPLLCSGYDLVPTSVLLDCCWGGRHFFRDCWRIHCSELIAYWMIEGYFGPVNNMKAAYERGHQILTGLLDYRLLKNGA